LGSEVKAKYSEFIEVAERLRVNPDRHILGGELLERGWGFRPT